jgi:hypothetical protein
VIIAAANGRERGNGERGEKKNEQKVLIIITKFNACEG